MMRTQQVNMNIATPKNETRTQTTLTPTRTGGKTRRGKRGGKGRSLSPRAAGDGWFATSDVVGHCPVLPPRAEVDKSWGHKDLFADPLAISWIKSSRSFYQARSAFGHNPSPQHPNGHWVGGIGGGPGPLGGGYRPLEPTPALASRIHGCLNDMACLVANYKRRGVSLSPMDMEMVENQLMGLSSLMRELQQALMREAMAPGTGRRSMGRSEVVVPQHGGYATETAFPGTIALAPGSRLPLETDISGHLYKQIGEDFVSPERGGATAPYSLSVTDNDCELGPGGKKKKRRGKRGTRRNKKKMDQIEGLSGIPLSPPLDPVLTDQLESRRLSKPPSLRLTGTEHDLSRFCLDDDDDDCDLGEAREITSTSLDLGGGDKEKPCAGPNGLLQQSNGGDLSPGEAPVWNPNIGDMLDQIHGKSLGTFQGAAATADAIATAVTKGSPLSAALTPLAGKSSSSSPWRRGAHSHALRSSAIFFPEKADVGGVALAPTTACGVFTANRGIGGTGWRGYGSTECGIAAAAAAAAAVATGAEEWNKKCGVGDSEESRNFLDGEDDTPPARRFQPPSPPHALCTTTRYGDKAEIITAARTQGESSSVVATATAATSDASTALITAVSGASGDSETDDLGQAFGLLWAGAGDDTDGHHLSPPQSLLSLSSDDEPQQQSLELGQQQQQSQRGDTAAKENSPPKTDSEAEANNGKLVNFSGLDQTFADEAVAAMLLGNTATGGNVRPDGGSGGGGESPWALFSGSLAGGGAGMERRQATGGIMGTGAAGRQSDV